MSRGLGDVYKRQVWDQRVGGSNPFTPTIDKKGLLSMVFKKIKQTVETDEFSKLARLSQAGDKKAYNKLLTKSIPYIHNVLNGSLSDQDALDDITQEVLISIHKALKTYSPDKKFKPWLYSIIQFRRTDYLRKYY